MTARLVFENAYIATVDASGSEFDAGHVIVDGSRIVAVGAGPVPESLRRGEAISGSEAPSSVEIVDARGHLLTPGLINTHHHLYQWLTRGIAQDNILFDWLTALYPTWARITEPLVEAGAAAAVAVLARSGCTTVADHHYVFPQGSGDILGGIVRASQTVGVRLHGTRGSMDLGQSAGGLPPDFAVETTDSALQASSEAVLRFHDPAPDARVQIALAPCSPFSVTADLLRESAVLARQLGVRLHTHGSETVEEDAFCQERFGTTPTQYLDDLGWLGDDVWMAHSVHLDDDAIARFGATGTGTAHCPSSNARLAAGIAPIPQLLRAGAPVGLGVDGSASNESGQLGTEIRQAVLMNRLRAGADGFSVRDGLRIATAGGARVLGRDSDLGSIEVGKLADLALWRIDGVEFAGIADPVATLGLAAMPPLSRLYVGGAAVVDDGHLTGADEGLLAEAAARASATLQAAA